MLLCIVWVSRNSMCGYSSDRPIVHSELGQFKSQSILRRTCTIGDREAPILECFNTVHLAHLHSCKVFNPHAHACITVRVGQQLYPGRQPAVCGCAARRASNAWWRWARGTALHGGPNDATYGAGLYGTPRVPASRSTAVHGSAYVALCWF